MFPFNRFPGVDTVLGPEMKSTGEVIGLDYDYALAFASSLGAITRSGETRVPSSSKCSFSSGWCGK